MGGIEGGERQHDYLSGIGAKSGMGLTAEDVTMKVAAKAAEEKKKNPNFDLDAYLSHHGWSNQDDRITFMSAIQNSDVYTGVKDSPFNTFMNMGRERAAQNRIDVDPAKNAARAAAIMWPLDDSIRVDPGAAGRIGELTKDAADVARGTGANGMLYHAREQAFNRLRGLKKTSGTFEESEKSNIYQRIFRTSRPALSLN